MEQINALISLIWRKLKNMLNELLAIDLSEYDEKINNWNMYELIKYRDNLKYSMLNIKNIPLSNKISSLFTNTYVHVCIYPSWKPNAYTIPGYIDINPHSSISSVIWGVLGFIFQFICPLITVICTIISNKELFANAIKPEYNNSTITYDPITKKINCAIPEVTAFIASIVVEKFPEDEIIALILHEIGHNTQCAINAIQQTMQSTAASFFTFLIVSPLGFKSLVEIDKRFGISIKTTLIFFVAIIVFFNFIAAYLSRRQEYASDEFAAKCGYGEALKSSLSRIAAFVQSYTTFQKNFSSITLKCEYYIAKLLKILYNIITLSPLFRSHPYHDERIETINNTIKNANKIDNLYL